MSAAIILAVSLSTIINLSYAQKPSSRSTNLQTCRSSADCDFDSPCAISRCLPFAAICVSANTTSFCPGTFDTISRTDIISQLNGDPTFTLEAKLSIIETATTLLRKVHPHRSLHLKFLGVDPVADLSRLRRLVLGETTDSCKLSTADFHAEMKRIFLSIDDRHSAYIAPMPLRRTVAFLPISITDFFSRGPGPFPENATAEELYGEPQFLIDEFAIGFKPHKSSFKVGVEVVEWNGRPIKKAVLEAGEDGAGANEAAKLRTGLWYLTTRFLRDLQFPDMDNARIGYLNARGELEHVTVDWIYISAGDDGQMESVMPNSSEAGSEEDPDELNHHVQSLMADNARLDPSARELEVGKRMRVQVSSFMESVFYAEIVGTSSGTFGYIKIFSFDAGPGDFLFEYFRLLGLLPSTGVIIDVRGNPGGSTANIYATLTLISNMTLNPRTFQLRVTPLTTALTNNSFLSLLAKSANFALQTGDEYSTDRTFLPIQPYVPLRGFNVRPTVILTDGASYSAADGVAASAIDNELALIIGVDGSTGGGGSAVVNYRNVLLRPFEKLFPRGLPDSVDFTISLLRTLRVGEFKGISYEFFGVKPDIRYFPTARDRLENDVDLIDFSGSQLAKMEEGIDILPSPDFEDVAG